ncbi:MAG: type II toxin-antitoxin system RelE family toxin [Verrucomicrobiota bacterium]
MHSYSVTFARSARKELSKLPPHLASRIFDRISALENNPRPQGVLKLQGSNSLWRIRIGDYRVVYEIDDKNKIADIVAIRHRRNVYRDY